MGMVGGMIIGSIITWIYTLAIINYKELTNKKNAPPPYKDYGFSLEILDVTFKKDQYNIYRTKELYFATDLQNTNFYGVNPSVPLTKEEFLSFLKTKTLNN